MRLSFRAALVPFLLLAGCTGTDTSLGTEFPDLQLVMPSTGEMAASLASCSTQKCLTVVVAPWCSVCHSATGTIISLRGYLKAAGVASRVVVGLSPDYKELKAYAEEFGPDAQIDIARALKPSGVPMFIVSDAKGKILKTVAGIPSGGGTSAGLAYALGF